MSSALLISFVAFIGIVYYGRAHLSDKSLEVVELKLRNIELLEQQTAYRSARANVEKYAYVQEIMDSALPKEKDQAKTARQIFLLAEQSGITLSAIQYPASTLSATPAAPIAKQQDGSDSVQQDSAKPTEPQKTISQAEPVTGLAGVYSIKAVVTPITDDTNPVTYEELIDYLSRLESDRRALQVTDIQVSPQAKSTGSPTISFTLTIKIFIKP